MTGGTLLISRNTENHSFFKKYIEDFGFQNVHITDTDRDGLKMLIAELKPELVMIEACYYKCCTPYMMSELLVDFPELNIAAVNIYDYPEDLAMWFIFYGVKSYISLYEGIEEFKKGLNCLKRGNYYISPYVQKRIELRNEIPEIIYSITPRYYEIMKLISCGFNNLEVGEIMHITRKTAYTHRNIIYKMMNVRNSNELIRTVLYLKYFTTEDLYFYPKYFTLSPKPKIERKRRKNVS